MRRAACVLLVCFMATPAFAQGPGPGAPVGLAAGLQNSYNRIKGLLTASADKLSDADNAFKPTAEIRN